MGDMFSSPSNGIVDTEKKKKNSFQGKTESELNVNFEGTGNTSSMINEKNNNGTVSSSTKAAKNSWSNIVKATPTLSNSGLDQEKPDNKVTNHVIESIDQSSQSTKTKNKNNKKPLHKNNIDNANSNHVVNKRRDMKNFTEGGHIKEDVLEVNSTRLMDTKHTNEKEIEKVNVTTTTNSTTIPGTTTTWGNNTSLLSSLRKK